MADHSAAHDTGPDIDALIEDRMRMWSGFTNAIVAAIVFIVLLLISMAFFLL